MGGAVKLALVPVAEVPAVLEDVMAWISSAFERGVSVAHPLERVRRELEAGGYRLLLGASDEAVHACVVLEVTDNGEGGEPFLFVVAAGGVVGGTFGSVGEDMWRGILDLARAWGLKHVRLVGRQGWARWCGQHSGGGRVRVLQTLIECGVM